MASKRSLKIVFGLTLLAALVFGAMRWRERVATTGAPRSQPVVVFVVLDTVRADRTSLCGYEHPTTPTLDELAESGATFACNSHAPSTWTLPSHASFFTGLGLDRHQSGGGGGTERMKTGSVTPLGAELPTLAEEMSARGYQTLLLSGNPVVSERMGLTRGFDRVAIGRRYPMMHDHRLAKRLRGLLRVSRLDSSRPLFLFVNIADAHSPWTAIPDGVDFVPPRAAMSINPGRERYESGQMSDAEAAEYLAHLSDVYDYAVFRADRSLGLVLEVLESRGWLDQGYRLIVTSDHGEYLGEHGLVEHGRSFFYEPVTRVPFLYFSTEGALPLPDDLPSIAAHALARDGALPDAALPGFAAVFLNATDLDDSPPPCSYARAGLWKDGDKLVAEGGEVVRFELQSDPDEMAPRPSNSHRDAPAILSHCRALDQAYISRPALDPAQAASMNDQLRALGYLRDGDEEPATPEIRDEPRTED